MTVKSTEPVKGRKQYQMRNFRLFASMALVSNAFAFVTPITHADVVSDVVRGVAELAAKDSGQAASRTISNTLNPGGNKCGGRGLMAAMRLPRPTLALRLRYPTRWSPIHLTNKMCTVPYRNARTSS